MEILYKTMDTKSPWRKSASTNGILWGFQCPAWPETEPGVHHAVSPCRWTIMDFRLEDAVERQAPHPNTHRVRYIPMSAAAATNYPFVWHVSYVRAWHAMMSMDYLMAMATIFLAILLNLMHQGSLNMETWRSKAAVIFVLRVLRSLGVHILGALWHSVLLGTRPLKIWRSSSMPNQSSWQQKAKCSCKFRPTPKKNVEELEHAGTIR